MRVNRSKFVRKYLRFYRIVYNIIPKYKIILDGNFIFAALKHNIDIFERLTKLLQGEQIRMFITKSSLKELVQVGLKAEAAKQFAKSKCEILDDDSYYGETPSDKMLAMLAALPVNATEESNSRQYFVASQDKEFRQQLGRIPGIPIIYLNKVIMVMEPPSDVSKQFNCQLELEKTQLKLSETSVLETLGEGSVSIVGGSSSSVSVVPERRVKRKASAPNPLSHRPPDK
eukprot:gene3641-7258_t